MPPISMFPSDGHPAERAFRDHLRERARQGDERVLAVVVASRAGHALSGLWSHVRGTSRGDAAESSPAEVPVESRWEAARDIGA